MKLNLKQRLIEYIIFVGIAYGLYVMVLGPVFYFSIGLTIEQIQAWLWQGFLVDAVLAYPTAKLIIHTRDKVRKRWFNE